MQQRFITETEDNEKEESRQEIKVVRAYFPCASMIVYVTRKLCVHCTCYWVNFLPAASVGQTSGPDHTSNPLNYLWGTASHICHRDGPHCQICTSANGALNQAKHVHFECVWWLIYIYELLLLVLSQKETRARPHPKPINYVRGTATHICCYCQTCSCAESVSCEQSIFQTTPLVTSDSFGHT